MKTLNKQQIDHFTSKMINNGNPVRFQDNGQAVNVITGDKQPKGINIIHQHVYWNFDKKTAKEIAKITGTKAIFSE